MKVLIDHMSLKRRLTDSYDRGIGWAGAGRIPRGPTADDEHQIRLVEIWTRVKAKMQRMALWEVGVIGRAFNYRNGEQVG